MNAFPAARRPNRTFAIATLLLLHGAAIEWLLHLQATRDRDAAHATTLLLLAPRERDRAEAAATLPAPRAVTRPLVAPVPLVDVPAPDGPAVIATPPAAATGDGPHADRPAPSLDLKIPKSFFENEKKTPLTPAQEAMQDPRSNHLELTRQEKLDIAFGVIECVAWQREPDGSIYRGPGHLRRLQGVSTNPFTAHKPGQEDRPMECVK